MKDGRATVAIPGVMDRELEGAGFRLEEQNHWLILKYRGQEVEWFDGWTTSVKTVNEAARAWLRENGTG